MAIISKQTVGGKWILEVDQAPNTGAGVIAPIGSEAYYSDGVNGFTFVKTGASDLDWVCDSDEVFNVINLKEQADNPNPPVDGLNIYSLSITGRKMLKAVGPSGLDYALQPHIGRNKTSLWQANGNATTTTAIGQAFSTTGTGTTRTVSSATFFGTFRRLGYVSNNGAGSTCGIRTTVLQYHRGNIAKAGGFHFITRFGISDASAVATGRMFIGLLASGAIIGNVEPSTLTNILGFGADSSDINLQFIHNDGAGTATKINLGASFPVNTRNTDMYEVSIFCPPNGNEVFYQVLNLTNDQKVSGSVSINIPSATQLLAYQLWRNNGSTALAVGLDIVNIYMETDN